ncbi:MAG TPA: hypothetical protein PKN36_10035 [bacterium]|nr:hypothetical protein [bacterium]
MNYKKGFLRLTIALSIFMAAFGFGIDFQTEFQSGGLFFWFPVAIWLIYFLTKYVIRGFAFGRTEISLSREGIILIVIGTVLFLSVIAFSVRGCASLKHIAESRLTL